MSKGGDVAHSFFDGWGLPFLLDDSPDLVERVAAVICGGSQCLGNDDELSRDHGWGPHFTLILTGEDMRRRGRGLCTRINRAAPRNWDGYELRGNRSVSVKVASINRWFREEVKCSHPPTTFNGWYHGTREDNLCMLRYAPVFYDPLGERSARRSGFSSYPDEVWEQRIKDELFTVWHFGQYNFLDRLTRRQDPVAISVALGKFSEGVMRMSLVMGHEYCPYWKWLAAQFRKLPDVEAIDTWLRELASTTDLKTQADLVDEVCTEMHKRLVAMFDLDPNPTGHPHPLFCARHELAARDS